MDDSRDTESTRPPSRPSQETQDGSRLRLDRDRFVAFAFAAADLLIEIDRGGRIVNVMGAARTICGMEPSRLIGQDVLTLIATADQPIARQILLRAVDPVRLAPTPLRLGQGEGASLPALVGVCILPARPGLRFMTVTLLPPALAVANAAVGRDPDTGLPAKDVLMAAALEAGGAAGPHKHMTLVQIDGLSSAAASLPRERAHALMAEIGATLRVQSLGMDAAARLDGDTFGLITSAGTGGREHAAINAQIAQAARVAGVLDGLITTEFACVDLPAGQREGQDAVQALTYVITTFTETRGKGLTWGSLQQGLAAEIGRTVSRFGETQRLIAEGGFSLVFQPVVRMDGRSIHHYEALSRFSHGQPTGEMIAFTEGVGLVEELDLAVCRKAIAALGRSQSVAIAVNISGRSVQSDMFRGALADLLSRAGDLTSRLIFELTESAIVKEVDAAATFLRCLRSERYRICLDDFGSGAAAYGYLRHFDVDFVKIDGPFLKAATFRPREAALVASICRLCDDLGSQVIGEMVETEQQAAAAAALGVSFGQGWLFGKPLAELPMPEFRSGSNRRKGVKESWG